MDAPLLALSGELILAVLTTGVLESADLCRLECTATVFRRGLIDEAARVLCAKRPDRDRCPRRSDERWLQVLHLLEVLDQPLAFTRYVRVRCSHRYPCCLFTLTDVLYVGQGG